MASIQSSRRSFLKAVGASAMAFPFYRLLESSAAYAQTAGSPLRFLFIATPHGTAYEYWRPQGTETSFNITYPNAILAPLAPFQSKINILDGVDMRTQSEDADFGHLGTQALLTGVGVTQSYGSDSVPAGAESLDQNLARQLGGATAFRSLELSLGDWDHYWTLSFDRTGSAVPRVNNPLTVFSRIFANVMTGAPNPALVRQLAEKKSILDAVQSDITSLQTRLGPTEKQKLNQHLTAIRDIEARLSSTAAASCMVPPKPSGDWASTSDIDEYFDPTFIPEFGSICDLQLDMITQAFACDLTRFATLQILHSGAEVGMPYVDASLANLDIHADIAHKYNYGSGDSVSGQLALMQRWFATKVAYVINALSQIPEGDGTVLDHTIVLWMSDQGDPANHYYNNIPTVMAGGANGKFRMGRYIKYSMEVDPYCPPTNNNCSNPASTNLTWLTPHNQLLVSICQAFGLTNNTYGWTGSSGPLANLV
jgi:hypothetical protein